MTVLYSDAALRQLKKLDRSAARRIVDYMSQIGGLSDPRLRGKALIANFSGKWRYRVGDFRIVCTISDKELTVCVVKIEKRDSVYKAKR